MMFPHVRILQVLDCLDTVVEMASASDVTFELSVTDIAYLQDAYDYAKMGLVPAGAYKNKRYSIDKVEVGSVNETYLDLLYDPQTSGGLLISVSPKEYENMMRDFKNIRTGYNRFRNRNSCAKE